MTLANYYNRGMVRPNYEGMVEFHCLLYIHEQVMVFCFHQQNMAEECMEREESCREDSKVLEENVYCPNPFVLE